jgi:hypothetical protein
MKIKDILKICGKNDSFAKKGLRAFVVMRRTPFTGGAEARLVAAGTLLTDRKDGYDAQERLGHSSMDVGGGA